jgi:hypothetical protein
MGVDAILLLLTDKWEKRMFDLVYLGLGTFLFVSVAAYARACARL